nr:non-homologous end-joining DNA ligase [Dyella sp. ASV24]
MTITPAADPVITHPERLVFPADDITKLDVADYYQTVMSRFLPGIAGRPTSVYRFPEGTTKPGFFQKHPMRGLRHVEHIALREENGAMGDYICPNDASAVIELVQYGVIEFHPWASRAIALEEPDYLVFDLDPGDGVSWPEITEAARWIRGRLEEASLKSFVRTTGGKGLHVVVPLHTSCHWDDAYRFSHAFAHSMADEQPGAFTAKANKAGRKGRIFIDYLRNTRGATSVASWSVRARPGAPVAMPLRWQDLARCTSGHAFDIRSARRRLSRLRSSPWEGFATMRQSLHKPMRIYGSSKA